MKNKNEQKFKKVSSTIIGGTNNKVIFDGCYVSIVKKNEASSYLLDAKSSVISILNTEFNKIS